VALPNGIAKTMTVFKQVLLCTIGQTKRESHIGYGEVNMLTCSIKFSKISLI